MEYFYGGFVLVNYFFPTLKYLKLYEKMDLNEIYSPRSTEITPFFLPLMIHACKE